MIRIIYLAYLFMIGCQNSIEELHKLKIERNKEGFLTVKHTDWNRNLEFACVANVSNPVFNIDTYANILYLFDCFKTLMIYDIASGKKLDEYVFKPVDRHAIDFKLELYQNLLIFSSNHHLWIFNKELDLKFSIVKNIIHNNIGVGEFNRVSYSITRDKLTAYFTNYSNIGYEQPPLGADTIIVEYKILFEDEKLELLH